MEWGAFPQSGDVEPELNVLGILCCRNNGTCQATLGPWVLTRGRVTWRARAPRGEGFPESLARELDRLWYGDIEFVRFDRKAFERNGAAPPPSPTYDDYILRTPEGLRAFVDIVREMARATSSLKEAMLWP